MNQLTNQSEKFNVSAINGFAVQFAQSGMFGISKGAEAKAAIAKCFVAIQAGAELGIPPFAAIQAIQIIQGKLQLAAGAMSGLIRNSGKYDYKLLECTDEICTLEFHRGPDKLGLAQFTIEEAKRVGLVKAGSGWVNYPSDMLFARALSRGFRRYTPELALGMTIYVESHGENEIPEPVNITPQAREEAPESTPAPTPVNPPAEPEVFDEERAVSVNHPKLGAMSMTRKALVAGIQDLQLTPAEQNECKDAYQAIHKNWVSVGQEFWRMPDLQLVWTYTCGLGCYEARQKS